MVDDPSSYPDLFPTEKKQEKERQRLFRIIEDLVLWENTNNEKVLQAARDEIWASWRRACAENADHPRAKELFDRNKLPAFHDPFAGGGSLPLEAQRLGLESYASDLNPVAVLINKAMIEIPPKFAGRPPVNPDARKNNTLLAREWKGAQGLAEDVRYYGQWMRDEAEKRIGHLYPKIEVTAEMAMERPDLKPYVGRSLTVIAWLWARTVKSPNPAFANVEVPLVSTFMLSTKAAKQVYVEPVIEDGGYRFTVKVGNPKSTTAKNGTRLSRGANFRCLMSGAPIGGDYLRAEASAGRMGARLMAIAAEGDNGRVYVAPTPQHEAILSEAQPEWRPDVEFLQQALGFRVGNYGMSRWSDLFTNRQLVALGTFSGLVREAQGRVLDDAVVCLERGPMTLGDGGLGASAYAEAVAVYLACGVSRSADFWSNLCIWANQPKNELVTHLFGRQAISMAWDYGEVNPFSGSGGNFDKNLSYVARGVDCLGGGIGGSALQVDAASNSISHDKVVSTDPPYYDNIGYADLSDYFYVWLRRSLRSIFPDMFATLAVPKAEELVATPHRHGGREQAEAFFLEGMTRALKHLGAQVHSAFPVTIYYAFKQAESDEVEGVSSTGWATFLGAVINAGFAVTGTWPMRTERSGRLRDTGSNALASSIVLVCRRRDATYSSATRREFIAALKAELPNALVHLQAGNIAPVDLQMAAIGPGMAVYTRYAQVVDAEGNGVSVGAALALIFQALDETLAHQEGDFDADTRWAVAWFEQYGFADGEYGVAETLSKAKNTSVQGLVDAGILRSSRGKVRLLSPKELLTAWDPATNPRLSIWEIVHHLIRILEADGEVAAADLVARLGTKAETARELAYRLYAVCERKKRAADALAYNGPVQSFPEIVRLSRESSTPPAEQGALFERKGT
jgi:putative DNA methylase